MAKVIVLGCERCRAVFDPGDPNFFVNGKKDRLHLCPDSIAGAVEEIDPAAKPTLSKIQVAGGCVICGGPQTPVKRSKRGALWCPACLVFEKRDAEGRPVYVLDELESWLPSGGTALADPKDAEPGSRMARPTEGGNLMDNANLAFAFNWVRSISGCQMKPSQVSRAFGFNRNSLEHLKGNVGRGKLEIVCGTCASREKNTVMRHFMYYGVMGVALRARGRINVDGLHAAFVLACPDCDRHDYYLFNANRDKWTWCYTIDQTIQTLKARGVTLTEDEKRDAVAARPPDEPEPTDTEALAARLRELVNQQA